MARKVLISFLGAAIEGTYRDAKYKFGNKVYAETFFANAIRQHHEIDEIVMVGTMKSMWEEVYRSLRKDDLDEDYYLILSDKCKKANHQTPIDETIFKQFQEEINNVRIIPIEYGIDERSMKFNLDTILQKLDQFLLDGDQIILDITHSFRSLPMLITTTLLYLTDVYGKKVNIVDVLYGMLDASGDVGYTPVVSLKAILDLNNWIKAAHAFQEYGKTEKLAELLATNNQKLSKDLQEMGDILSINYASTLEEKISSLSSIVNNQEFDQIAGMVLRPVFKKFKSKFDQQRNDKPSKFQLALGEWFLQNKNYSSAYVLLAEAMITFTCEQEGRNAQEKSDRDAMKTEQHIGKYFDFHSDVSRVRNVISHASIRMRPNVAKYKQAINQLKERFQKARKIIFN